MAEKITIFELDIDIDASKKDVEDLRLAVNDLKKGLKELSDAEKENNKQLDEQRKKLEKLLSAKNQDKKAIKETQNEVDKLLTKRTELNKNIVEQTTKLKVNQSALRENQKVIEGAINTSDRYNKELEEEKIKLQLVNAERKKVIREGIKLANETKELTVLQNKQNKSEAETIRLNSILVKRRKNLIVNSKATRKEYRNLTKAIERNSRVLRRNDKEIGRFQRTVGNYASGLRGLVGAVGLTGGVIGAVQLIRNTTDAYRDQALEVEKLVTILRQRANATDQEIESLLELTAVEQQRGIIGDEIQIAGAQQISTFVTSTETVNTLIPALNNLLAQQKGVNATQQDAVTISNLFGKALQGQTSALTRVGISFTKAQKEILKFGDESERAAVLAQVVTDNVGEINEALASTELGQLQQLKNELGDTSEELGEALLPALVAISKALIPVVKGFSLVVSLIKEAASGAGIFNAIAKKGFEETVDIQKSLSGVTENFIDLRQKLIDQGAEENKANKDAFDLTLDQFQRRAEFLKEELKLLGEQTTANARSRIRKSEIIQEAEFIKQKVQTLKIAAGIAEEEIKTNDALESQIKIFEELTDAQQRELQKRKKQRQKEEEDIKRENERRIAEEQKTLDAILQRQVDQAEKAKEEILRLTAETEERRKQQEIINQENELALLEGNLLSELEIERIKLERQYEQEIEFAEKIGADRTLIEKKFSNAREEIARAENNAKLSLAQDFFSNIAQIAGEGTAVGKAAAVAATTISTYQAATGAFASLSSIPIVGPVLGAVAAAAAIAAGIANVRKILAVKTGLPGDTGGGGGGAIPSTGGTAAPVTQRPGAIAPEINQGIISRDIPLNNQNQPVVETAVIVDEVTAKQNQQDSNSNTSVI
jgi:hypothetical protein